MSLCASKIQKFLTTKAKVKKHIVKPEWLFDSIKLGKFVIFLSCTRPLILAYREKEGRVGLHSNQGNHSEVTQFLQGDTHFHLTLHAYKPFILSWALKCPCRVRV